MKVIICEVNAVSATINQAVFAQKQSIHSVEPTKWPAVMKNPERDWAQKYRPTRMDDVVLPAQLSEKLNKLVRSVDAD
jgi:hypothetical protein